MKNPFSELIHPSAAKLAEKADALARQADANRATLGATVLDADDGNADALKAKAKASAALADTERLLAEVRAAIGVAAKRETDAAVQVKADDSARRWIETEARLGLLSDTAKQIEEQAAKLGTLWADLLKVGESVAEAAPTLRPDARDALLGFAVEYCLRTSLAKAGMRFASPVTGSTLDQQPGLADHCRHVAELVLYRRAA